jgi:hypothetical protein
VETTISSLFDSLSFYKIWFLIIVYKNWFIKKLGGGVWRPVSKALVGSSKLLKTGF